MLNPYVGSGRFVVLLVLLVALAACGAAPTGQTGTSPSTNPTPLPSASPRASAPVASQQSGQVTDVDSLIAALQAQGLTVEEAGTVSQPFFDVEGTQLRVQDADVQVFAFADAEAAQSAVATLGPDGNPPTMMIEWVASPHFYQSGPLVVLYVGDDAAITQALSGTLGEQVAGR